MNVEQAINKAIRITNRVGIEFFVCWDSQLESFICCDEWELNAYYDGEFIYSTGQ